MDGEGGEKKGKDGYQAQPCVYLLESVFTLFSQDSSSTVMKSSRIVGMKEVMSLNESYQLIPFYKFSVYLSVYLPISSIYFSVYNWTWDSPK
jgi:hypothetical protein